MSKDGAEMPWLCLEIIIASATGNLNILFVS